MANWLEGATWDVARADQVTELNALPYVRIVDPDDGSLLPAGLRHTGSRPPT